MKLSELKSEMSKFNAKHGVKTAADRKKNESGELICMSGKIVLKPSALSRAGEPYPEEMRTYMFTNYEKALTPCDGGCSIFAVCEADDDCMRIERLPDSAVESAEIEYVCE